MTWPCQAITENYAARGNIKRSPLTEVRTGSSRALRIHSTVHAHIRKGEGGGLCDSFDSMVTP